MARPDPALRLRALTWLLAAVAAAGLLAGAAAAAAQEDWSEVVRGDSETGVVALTFDAGGVAGSSQRVIDALRERGLRVTFFLSGQWVDQYPQLALQIAQDGHELANHSYTHPDFVHLPDARIARELERTDEVVAALAGRHTRPFFRPPFGSRNARVLRAAADAGFRSVFWTLDSADWREGIAPAVVRDRVLRLAGPGDIVVMHVASEATAAVLPQILDTLAERAWRVGTVSEVLGQLPPPPDPAPAAPAPFEPGQPAPLELAAAG